MTRCNCCYSFLIYDLRWTLLQQLYVLQLRFLSSLSKARTKISMTISGVTVQILTSLSCYMFLLSSYRSWVFCVYFIFHFICSHNTGGDVVIARQPLENMYLVHSLLLLACCKEAYRGHSSFFWCKLTSLIYFLLSYQGNIENNSLFSSLIFNISYCFRIIVWFLWKWIILECVYLQNFLQPSV